MLGNMSASDEHRPHRGSADETALTDVKITVVVPMHDAGFTIGDQLDALLSQDGVGQYEVVVVDDGSRDEGPAVVEDVACRDDRVRLVATTGGHGPAHARNFGAGQARGAMIAFCDADDVVAPGWLAALAEALGHAVAATGPQEQRALNPPWLQNLYGSDASSGPQHFAGMFPFGPSSNLAFRRDVFRSLGGFDSAIRVPAGEDIELCMRLWDRGDELAFAPQAVVHYRNRSRLGDIWRQARLYGAAAPMLVARLERLGYPVPHRWRGARNWLWLVRRLPTLRTRAGRVRWLVVAGLTSGRLEGSLRWRCVYL